MKLPRIFQKPAPKTKKGRVFLVTDRGEIVPWEDAKEFQTGRTNQTSIRKDSQQKTEGEEFFIDDGLIEQPFDYSAFYFLYESNVHFAATIEQIAIDVAGLGWKLVPRGEGESQEQFDKISALLDNINSELSFRRLNKAMILDWGIAGMFALEVVRKMLGDVSEIHHLSPKNLYVHKSRKKYCQKIGTKKTWFPRFAAMNEEIQVLDPATGNPGALGIQGRANEVIFYRRYYPSNSYYGVPRILPATGELITTVGIRDFNLSFFERYGIPAYLITLIGDWEENITEDGDEMDAVDIVKKYFEDLTKGADRTHSTAVFHAPEGCDIKVEPLSVDRKEGSFTILLQLMTDHILAAYSMPLYRLGISRAGALGGNEALELTKNYKNGVVQPLQMDLEDIWSDLIFAAGLNCPDWRIDFDEMDVSDEKMESEIRSGKIRTGQMTPNQARKEEGKEGYPGGNFYYMEMGLIQVGEDVDSIAD